ncbi:MAG: hypothetical protein IJ272_04835 [Clostridia bacterium]|nr:hypothetical protein [Clostridia bacterium]
MASIATKNKVPVSVTGIARMMEMDVAEVRNWPHFEEMRDALKDYNLGALTKQRLITRLNDISIKCANDGIYHYSTGIDNAITSIRLSY